MTLQGPLTVAHWGGMKTATHKKLIEFIINNPSKFGTQSYALMPLKEVVERFRKKDMATFFLIVRPDLWVQVYNTPLPGVLTFCCPCVDGNGTSNLDLTRGEIDLARMISDWIRDMKAHIHGFETAFLIDQPDICVRETRHIKGEYLLTASDMMSMRHFEDAIGRGGHPVDIYPIPPEIKGFDMPHKWSFEIPYRCLVPLQVDNLLVAGRCVSVTREVNGSTRTTVQCMITGEAAGNAAGLCVKNGTTPRTLDPRILRESLLRQGAVL
jgi:hypothetical protein